MGIFRRLYFRGVIVPANIANIFPLQNFLRLRYTTKVVYRGYETDLPYSIWWVHNRRTSCLKMLPEKYAILPTSLCHLSSYGCIITCWPSKPMSRHFILHHSKHPEWDTYLPGYPGQYFISRMWSIDKLKQSQRATSWLNPASSWVQPKHIHTW